MLARDPALTRDYADYYERLSGQYLALFQQLVEQGSLRQLAAKADLRRLVTASIIVWFNWISFLAALRPEREIDRADVAEGALHSFLVVEPHLEPRFAAAARKVIERHRRRARA